MQNTLTPIAATTAPAPIESRPSPRSASPHAFATLLRQSQTTAPAVAKAAPVAPARSDGVAEQDSPSRAGPAAANAATAAAQARRRTAASATSEADAAGRTGERPDDIDAATDRDDQATTDATSTPGAPGTGLSPSHGLVASRRLAADGHEPGTAGKDGRPGRTDAAGRGAAGDPPATTASACTAALASRAPGADLASKDAPSPSTRVAAASTDGGVARSAETLPLAEAATKTASLAPSELHVDAPGPAGLSPTPTSSPSVAAAPTDATVATPFASPDFAQAFAVQVTVLVQGGVQRAELHLNPTEMGPVSVQIVVDGSEARIEFGADALATRQAIEAGLPELAGALRDAGMTLQGGGVSQHARDPGPDPKSGAVSTSARGPRCEQPRPEPTLRQRVVAAGGVDLYA